MGEKAWPSHVQESADTFWCLAGVGLMLLTGKLHWRELLPLAMTAANTYGTLPQHVVVLLFACGSVLLDATVHSVTALF
jgi:hypothetical protein